jgi:hypothetical protein
LRYDRLKCFIRNYEEFMLDLDDNGPRKLYFDSLANEPLLPNFNPAWESLKLDLSLNGIVDWRGRVVNYQKRVVKLGIMQLPYEAFISVRAVVLDSYNVACTFFNLLSGFSSLNFFSGFNKPNLMNFAFSIWNVAADSVLIFSVFSGIILPSSRQFAKDLHKGNPVFFVEPKTETAREREEMRSKRLA